MSMLVEQIFSFFCVKLTVDSHGHGVNGHSVMSKWQTELGIDETAPNTPVEHIHCHIINWLTECLYYDIWQTADEIAMHTDNDIVCKLTIKATVCNSYICYWVGMNFCTVSGVAGPLAARGGGQSCRPFVLTFENWRAFLKYMFHVMSTVTLVY